MLKDIRKNPILLTDCYNLSHQHLKTNTDWEISHIYNRANGMILYGFTEIVTDILSRQITMEMVDEAETLAKRMGLSFPREIWERVVNECGGYLPLKVECLQDGMYCPTGTPFAQIQNTVRGFGEMVTWFEPIFIMAYFPSSCATEAYEMKNYLEEKRDEFGYDDSFLWRFHSFGFRGHKSLEDAYWAGTAWSLFLRGTDDFHIAQHMPNEIVMGSISALAHKVTQQYNDEYECFKHTIDSTIERGEKIVAMVIDTYDAWNVINNYVVPLTNYAKEKGVHLVFRPDSGDIFEQAVAIHKIAKENELTNISVIIGEGMSFKTVKEFDERFLEHGVPLNFINYGIGAGFYKHIERDTLGWAMKTAYSNGQPRMKIVKSNPFKQSIPNEIHLIYNEDGYMQVENGEEPPIVTFLEMGLYKIIYHYMEDEKDLAESLMEDGIKLINDIVFIYELTSEDFIITQDNVRDMSEECTYQERIVLSKETQELIAEFTEKYKH